MKKIFTKLICIVMLAFATNYTFAQVAAYTYSSAAGTYSPLVAPNVTGIGTFDDNNYPDLPIGFVFYYNGQAFTKFSANANGFLALGSTITSSYNSISAGSSNNLIALINNDLQGQPNGEISYLTSGSAPNRVLTVQYKNLARYQSAVNPGDTINAQIKLYESTNVIDLVYGKLIKGLTNGNEPYEVGLRGNSNADFNNRSATNNTTNNWQNSVAGALNNASILFSDTITLPPSGLTYTFTPDAPPANPTNLTFTAITTTAMTLNFVDSSTNESSFIILRSLDGLTFSPVGSVTSTTSAGLGTTYTFASTGLSNGTTYFWKIQSVKNTPSLGLVGSQATNAGTLCGTLSVGPTGTYTSLTAAIVALQANGTNCPVVLELDSFYVSTVETFPLIVPFIGNATTITIRPEFGATALSITSNNTIATFDLNAIRNLIIDGRPAGLATINELTVANSSLTGVALRMTNSVNNITLDYLNIKSVNNSVAAASVVIGNSIAGSNNNNITIQNCNLDNGLTSPVNLIFSANATVGSFNSNVNISNNNFSNNFSATLATNAVFASTASTAWTINNNSFYQTASRTYTTGNTHNAILVNSFTGNGFTITNNKIGGTAPNNGGTAHTILGTIASRFNGINVSTGAGAVNTITGNIITNIALTTSSGSTVTPGILCGITAAGTGGNYNIGTMANPNIIGSTTTNGAITTTSSTAGALTVGINSSASGVVNIAYNTVSGLTVLGTLPTISTSISGIQASNGTTTISNNIIGGVLLNSFTNASTTSTVAGNINGIVSSGSSLPTGNIIDNNTVTNLTNNHIGTAVGTTSITRGIGVTGGVCRVSNNTINTLKSSTLHIGVIGSTSVQGIGYATFTAGANNQILNNTIDNLSNTSTAAAAVGVAGIAYNNTGATPVVQARIANNKISSLTTTNPGNTIINGIQVTAGLVRVYNNFVNLGKDALGADVTNPVLYTGILKSATTNTTIAHNTISINGAGVNTTANATFAFNRTNTAIDSVYNNIFSNTRANGSSTGIHYAGGLNNATTYIANNNNFYNTAVAFGRVNGVDATTLGDWKTASAQDATSGFFDPNFISATNLHINNATTSSLESKGTTLAGITTDIDGQVRPGPVGSVNGGAFGVDIGADEFDGIPVSLDMGLFGLASPNDSGCYTATEVVMANVRNFSNQTINFSLNPVTVNVSATGVNPTVFAPLIINTGTLAANTTASFMISASYDMSATGTYTFSGSAIVVGDGATSNDAMTSLVINNIAGIASESVSNDSICGGSNFNMILTGFNLGASIQWQLSSDKIATSNILGANTATFNYVDGSSTSGLIYFRAEVCGNKYSNWDSVFIGYVTNPTAANVSRCGPGSVTVNATAIGPISWYTTPIGGSSFFTGNTYTTPVSANTSYYLSTEAFGVSTSAGAPNNTTGSLIGGGQQASTAYNTFDVFAPCQLTGTTVYPGAVSGNIVLVYADNTGLALQTVTYPIPAAYTAANIIGAPLFVPLNISLTPGTLYRLGQGTGSVSMFRSNAVTSFPFVTPGYISVNGSSAGTSFYYFTFNLQITTACKSARTQVDVTVTPAPAVVVTSTLPSVCDYETNTLTATSINPNYTYTWSPAIGLNTTTGASVIAKNNATVTYTLVANDTTLGCSNNATITATVKPSLSPAAVSSASSICSGNSVVLTGTSAQDATIGTNDFQNTASTYPAPYGAFYWGAKNQSIILASDLTAAGITAGNINSLSLFVTTLNAAPLAGFAIEMDTTILSSLTTIVTKPMPTVFSAVSYVPILGENIHNFNTSFVWNGVSNIIISTCFNNTGFTNNCGFQQTNTAYTSSVFYRADAAGVCATTFATGTTNSRPVFKLKGQSAPTGSTVSWIPSATVASPFTAISNATPTSLTNYQLVLTNTITGCSDTSLLAPVIVNALPTVSTVSDTICNGVTATISASGANSFVWDNGAGSLAVATVSPIINTTYTVIGTDLNGCKDTNTAIVIVNSLPTAPIITAPILAVCAPNAITLTSNVATGNTWNNGAGNATTAAASISGNYYSIITDVNGCLSDTSNVLSIAINPLPATPVITASALSVCSPNTITLKSSSAIGNTWSNAAIIDSVVVSTTGTFTVTVTDANTCTSAPSAAVTATINAIPTITATPNLTTVLAAANTTFSNPITLAGGVSYSVTVTPSANVTSSITNGTYTGTSLAESIGNNGTVTSGENIVYNVIGTDANGCSDTVNFTVTIDILVGLSNILVDKTLNIAPNPASNVFTVSSKDNFTLRMVDMNGKEIYSNTEIVKTTKVDVSNVSNGMYVLYITTDKGTSVRKVTVSK